MKKKGFLLLAVLVCLLVFGCSAHPKETGAESSFPADAGPVRVSYLGPEGTYTQEACERFFGERGILQPCKTAEDAAAAMLGGEADYAVIPQENTIGGAVLDYVDILIAGEGISIAGEVELTIRQNLLALPGAELSGIRTVYSHEQGLAQGRRWLEEYLPGAETIVVSSTAEGARTVSGSGDPSYAAIASAGCAGLYGLEILAADIQESDSNRTRFYVLSPSEPSEAPAGRLAFIAAGPAEELPGLMNGLRRQGMTLVTIHDRPRKTELGQYCYLIECSDCRYENYLKVARNSAFEFRYLGSFDAR